MISTDGADIPDITVFTESLTCQKHGAIDGMTDDKMLPQSKNDSIQMPKYNMKNHI